MNHLCNKYQSPKDIVSILMKKPSYVILLILSIPGFNPLISQPPTADYQLVFSDEFDAPISNRNWWTTNCKTHGEGKCEESMFYMAENVSVAEGHLKLTARAEEQTCNGKPKSYTSGQVYSATRYTYGYFEARVKLPEGRGFWPAFWLHATNANEYNNYEEIDIFENCGCDCNKIKFGTFYETDNNGNSGDHMIHDQLDDRIDDICNNFHVIGAEWTAQSITYYVDGIQRFTTPNINNHSPKHVLFNLAIEGCYGGCGPIEYCGGLNWERSTNQGGDCEVMCNTKFPQTYEVDWVKFYQKPKDILYFWGKADMCVGTKHKIGVSKHLMATYSPPVASPQLQVTPMKWDLTSPGVWKGYTVKPLTPGNHSFTVTVNFPSGHSETRTMDIHAMNMVPATPMSILLTPDYDNCCYNISTTLTSYASSYIWHINNVPKTTKSSTANVCLPNGTAAVSVQASNGCGTSKPKSHVYSLNAVFGCYP